MTHDEHIEELRQEARGAMTRRERRMVERELEAATRAAVGLSALVWEMNDAAGEVAP